MWNVECRYPYPILAELPANGRIGLFAVGAFVMTISTATLKWLYGRVNGYGTERTASSYPGDVKKDGDVVNRGK